MVAPSTLARTLERLGQQVYNHTLTALPTLVGAGLK